MGRAVRALARLAARVLTASERRVARQTFWANAIFGARLLGGLASVFIAARILGVDGFGALALIGSLCALIHGLANAPSAPTVTAFVARGVAEGRREEAASVFRFSLAFSFGAGLVAYAVIAALALGAGGALRIAPEHLGAALALGLGGVFTAANASATGVLYMADRMSRALAVVAVSTLLYVAALAVIWRTGGGIMEVALARTAADAAMGLGTLVVALASARRAGLTGLTRSASVRIPSDAAKFHAARMWISSVNALVNNLDVILLTRFAGASQAGVYGAARRVADMARSPTNLVRGAARAEYSRLWYGGRRTELRRAAFRMSGATFALAALIALALTAAREPIIGALLGADFVEGAGAALPILLLGALAPPTVRALHAATGSWRPITASASAALAAFLAAMLWLAPTAGATGAAWSRTAFFWTDFAIALPLALKALGGAGDGDEPPSQARDGGGEPAE